MSIEDSRYSPQIADKLSELKKQYDIQSEVLSKRPIEEVAMSYLQELEEIKKNIKNYYLPDIKAHTLILALGNARFIDQTLATENLKELMSRAGSDIFFDNNKFLIYGMSSDITIPDSDNHDLHEPEFGLWFNDRRPNLNPLVSLNSFQESWDRSDKNGRKALANFGRLSKEKILKKFETLARQNLQFSY